MTELAADAARQSFGGFPMRGLQLLAELAPNNNRWLCQIAQPDGS